MFFIVYFLAGISDIFDGYIARKTHNESQLGATLDSIADFLLIVVLLFILIPIIHIPIWIVIWIFCIAMIRGCSFIVGFVKYHAIALLHTYANKITGFALFSFPVIEILFGIHVTGYIICIIATISAIEELMINVRSKQLLRNVKSIFVK